VVKALVSFGALMAAATFVVAPVVAPDRVSPIAVPDQVARVPPPSPQPPPPVPPSPTDIHELTFEGGLAGLKNARLTPVATERGYDNQPSFTPDGGAILFTTNRGGLPTDIYEFDRKTRRTRQLTSTAEAEYSPTITPDGKGISVIRVEADSTQRLWRFDRDGQNPQLVLADIKPVGYHAWVDDDQLALFVLGQPSTLQHARVSTGKAVVIAQNIGRSLHRIPNTRTVSFVHREAPDRVWVKEFDPATGAVAPLVRMDRGNNEGDVAWMPDGTLLMSAASQIYAWRRGDKDWREVYDAAAHKLGVVSRMAVAPDGLAIAIVVNELAR
jgi:dipeptidyl aminopeptidase/acylaminoacyl peptidase